MYFDDFRTHPDKQLNPALLWEYDLSKVDYKQMRNVIVQRVIERGWPDDWYFMLNYYGLEGVKAAIKDINYLNDKDMNFVSKQFEIPFTDLKCYTKKQSLQRHWNS